MASQLPDLRVLMVAVVPARLASAIEATYGDRVRKNGEWLVTDGLDDTEAELSDQDVVITVRVKRRKR